MNEVMKSLLNRRSVRTYKADQVEEEKINQVVEAGLYAATGAGIQNVKFVVVTDPATREQLAKMNAAIMGRDNFDPFYGAPVIVIVLGDKDRTDKYVYDGSCAMMNMMNAAHALGLGSCWIHRAKEEFSSEEGKALLDKWGLKGNYEGIGHLALGYNSGKEPNAKVREEGRVIYVK